ncbi:MAG: prenyltransferase [Deltaproteobacteria bacterium]|nr:prenyltransferase [Deltaproteobacteria bacterium]
MSRLKAYFLSTRPQFLPGIAIPVAVGASVAWHDAAAFHALNFIITLFAALSYHAGMNVVNDYFDFRNGTDNINKNALTPFTGGSRFIQRGLISPSRTIGFGAVLILLGSIAGLYLVLKTSALLLVIGAFGLFTGFFYTAPPLFLAARGLGELIVGLDFGVLTVIGSYMVQTRGGCSLNALFTSLPVSFLIAALLYMNEFPDYEADRDAGKRNLVVRLGPSSARYGMVFLAACTYLGVIAGVICGVMPRLSLISLLSAFVFVPGVCGLFKNHDNPRRLLPSIKSVIITHLLTGLLLIISNLF